MMKSLIRSLSLLLVAGVLAQASKFDGPPGAPVRIEVFSDFECPHCRELHMGSLNILRSEYLKSGKVYLVHRDIALPQHPHARIAALYAAAAQKINKYDVVAGELFARQREWTATGKVDETVAAVLTPAEMTKVRAMISDKQLASEIDTDMAAAVKRQLAETPTLILVHKLREYPIRGNVEYTFLKKFIDQLLAK